jgi:hypothetical protein
LCFVWIEAAGKRAVTLTRERVSARNYISGLGKKLSGGRCAPGAVQRKRIARGYMFGERRKSCDKLDAVAQVQAGRRQCRHVQRLADMASRVRSVGVLVEVTAGHKEQQHGASQQRQCTARTLPAKTVHLRMHTRHFTLAL